MSRFEGQVAIVSGAAQGMGLAISRSFANEGANVVMADLNKDGVFDAALEIGDQALPVECDVTAEPEVQAMVMAAQERFGKIDVLVNNAGTVTMGLCVELSERDWDMVMAVNVKGVFLCSKAVLPHMLDRQSGSIISIASQAGKRGYPLFTHYCASKAAVIGFTRALAMELAPVIRVNAVCPGTVATPMMEREYGWETERTGVPRDELEQRWIDRIPLGRLQRPEDIAAAVLFLASTESSEMTGQSLNVDGGMVMD